MKLFKQLSEQKKQELIKFPAYISLLAASKGFKLNNAERTAVIKLSHTKFFICESILSELYREVDKNFENDLMQLEKNLPLEKENREVTIKKEIQNIEMIVMNLGEIYAPAMHRSLDEFKDRVLSAPDIR